MNQKELSNFKALVIKHKEADMPFVWELFSNDETANIRLEKELGHWALAGSKKEDYELVEVNIGRDITNGIKGINELKDTLSVLEMSGRKTIKISDVRYYLDNIHFN